jgi:putative ABC transport system permease protein
MNQLVDAIKIAVSSIWANKLRSFMMVLGNIVAVTSIIAVVSLIQGMNSYVSDAIVRDIGIGTFRVDREGVITSQADWERAMRRPKITLDEAHAIRSFSPLIANVMAEMGGQAQVVFGTETAENVGIRGVSPEYMEFAGFNVQQGRLPSRLEVERSRPVVFLGWGTADQLFHGRTAVDQVVRIKGNHFRVVGVSEKLGSMFGESQDEFVVIPLGSARKMLGSRQSLALTVKPTDPARIVETMDDARTALRTRRKLSPKETDNFGITTSDTLMDLWRDFSRNAFVLLVGIVSLSLVVGGIVIMNIMLMVVSERTREIGLRKALGARRRDIVWQVLTESTTLSIVGGIAGTVLGFVLAMLVAAFTPLPAAIQTWSVILGIGMTAAVGLLFGIYPAMRAARLDPIEALRRE